MKLVMDISIDLDEGETWEAAKTIDANAVAIVAMKYAEDSIRRALDSTYTLRLTGGKTTLDLNNKMYRINRQKKGA